MRVTGWFYFSRTTTVYIKIYKKKSKVSTIWLWILQVMSKLHTHTRAHTHNTTHTHTHTLLECDGQSFVYSRRDKENSLYREKTAVDVFTKELPTMG